MLVTFTSVMNAPSNLKVNFLKNVAIRDLKNVGYDSQPKHETGRWTNIAITMYNTLLMTVDA